MGSRRDAGEVAPTRPDRPAQGAPPSAPAPARVGSHRVESELGRGGMGVVYLAHDERLDRRVALKALPAQLVRDEAALVRLEQEARLLAAVNHPNVATIFGIEEAEGTRYLVLELVEGPTLAEQTADGALPMAQALSTCAQVAAGLAAAHERGVVHRDLKPANVKLTPKGAVKILDFGIASRMKADGIAGASSDGVSGTPGYMSPEQLRGEEVDQRCDAWAFGCLLFDCVAGAPAFPGDNLTDRIAATLQRDPDWTLLPEATPESVRTLLARCLVKGVAGRLADLSEARIELERAAAEIEAAAARPRGNLPTPASRFIGREREIEQVSQALRASRLVTLTGSGGCGKTRLAIAVAQLVRNEHPDGAWLVDLAPLADPRLVVHDVATALRVREQPGRALRETLVGSLKTKRVLLVLDNCEHLLDACSALLAMLVPACPDLRVLATSREPLGLAGEQTIRVGSLAMPEEAAGTVLSIDALLHFDAVALLVERAQLVNPDFVLSNANAADALAICRRLDGIPLAIELAAARLKVLSVAQVLERLKDRFKLLTTGSRAALPRHQTLRATLDWSHDHLSDAERVLYRRLAIFAGGCTLESAEAVCSGEGLEQPDILDLLTHLVDKSLLVACESQGEPRYRYLESVRQHAQEKLDAAGEVRWIRQRHCDLFVALAEQARPELAGGQQATWLQRLEQEHEELRAAQDWCQEASDAELSLRLVAALQEFWSMRGYWHEGRHRVESALDAAGSAGSPGARAAALSTGSWLALQQGDLDAAHRMESAALPLWRERGVVRGMAKSLNALANVAHYRGDQATARQLYAEALELDRSVDDRRGMAQILGNLGNVAFAEGDLASARSLHQQSLDMKRSLRDSHGAAMSLNNLGNVAVAGGDMASARAFHEESLALRRELGDRHGIAMSLNNLGSLLTTAGDLQMARSLLEESLSLHESLGDRRGIGYCLAYMSMLALASGDLAAAGRLSDRGLAIRRDFGDHRLVAQSLSTLVDIALARGDLCGGRALVAACLHELRTAGDSGAMVGVACRGAKLAIACGQPAVAAQLLGAWAATVGAGDDGPWPTDVGADAVARACEVLGATAFTSAIAAGRRLSLEDALMLIDVG